MNFIKKLSKLEFNEFMEKYRDKFSIDDISHIISQIEEFPEDFILEYKHDISWRDVFYEPRSEKFIEKYIDYAHFDLICRYSVLSENFIRKYQNEFDKRCWENLSEKRKFSEEFATEFHDKIQWNVIDTNPNLTDSFCEKFDNELCRSYICGDHNNDMFYWRINSKYHRTVGPAIIYRWTNIKEYWYRGKHLTDIHSDEELKRWLNLRAFA